MAGMAEVLPPEGSPFGDRVRERLIGEQVVWLTTVGADGTPQANPVWFLWDDAGVLVFNRPDAHRLVHIGKRPRVSLHFDSENGENVVVLAGSAEIVGSPAPKDLPAYVEKYGEGMVRVSGGREQFSDAYPVPMLVRIDRVRGF
ncbi:TIGR03667 family PPOX class F420-dependent oxidoreductase [Saccharomonospora sp. NPDC006951]